MDREKHDGKLSFTIVAYEKDDINSKVEKTITVSLQDINDCVPNIVTLDLNFEIDENKFVILSSDIEISDDDLVNCH